MLNIWKVIFITVLLSQWPDVSKPAFEIVSIKPNMSGDNRVSITNQPGGRFVATGAPLKLLMTSAYRVREFQILGGPSWISSDRWDINARPAEGTVTRTSAPDPNVPDMMSLMVQSLIEDRFQLKMHRETRELPTYELQIAKGGSKIKLSDDQTPVQPPQRGDGPPPTRRNSIRTGRGDIEASGIQFGIFINVLAQQLGRPIVDKTGLTGFYDFRLQWTPQLAQPDGDSSGPTIFTALQEQLGLRLESAKGPVEVIVIDSVQKPSEN